MPRIIESSRQLEMLEAFKEYMRTAFRKHVKETYGLNTYSMCIANPLEDFMQEIEAKIELLSEETIRDEELNYDDFQGE
jgi:hypothetical protein